MVVSFELSTEQASRIEKARLQGILVEKLFDEFLACLPEDSPQPLPKLSERNSALIALLQAWNKEDSDLEEGEALQREGEHFSAELKANRVSLTVPNLPV